MGTPALHLCTRQAPGILGGLPQDVHRTLLGMCSGQAGFSSRGQSWLFATICFTSFLSSLTWPGQLACLASGFTGGNLGCPQPQS